MIGVTGMAPPPGVQAESSSTSWVIIACSLALLDSSLFLISAYFKLILLPILAFVGVISLLISAGLDDSGNENGEPRIWWSGENEEAIGGISVSGLTIFIKFNDLSKLRFERQSSAFILNFLEMFK